MKNVRDSNMEILRVLCMVLIVMHHFAVHGGYIFDGTEPFFNRCVVDFFAVGGKIGVNCYVMISGYFLLNGNFRWRKLFKLLMEVFAYSSIIYFSFLCAGKISFTWNDLLHNLFPVIFVRYWFITAYIALYLLFPYINKFLKEISQKEHIILIIFLFIVQRFLSSSYFTDLSWLTDFGWFVEIYLIGAYIKTYPNKYFLNIRLNILFFVLTYILMAVLKSFMDISIYGMNSIVCLISSISLFNVFTSIKLKKPNKMINTIASTTLGIYLIHDNKLIRTFLWQDLIKCPTLLKSNYFILFAILAVLIVFVICVLIDLIRQGCIRLINKIIEKIKKSKESMLKC